MKVQIREIRSGKIKAVAKRYADVLVKLKQAEYHEDQIEKRNKYQTKVMVAEPPPIQPATSILYKDDPSTQPGHSLLP